MHPRTVLTLLVFVFALGLSAPVSLGGSRFAERLRSISDTFGRTSSSDPSPARLRASSTPIRKTSLSKLFKPKPVPVPVTRLGEISEQHGSDGQVVSRTMMTTVHERDTGDPLNTNARPEDNFNEAYTVDVMSAENEAKIQNLANAMDIDLAKLKPEGYSSSWYRVTGHPPRIFPGIPFCDFWTDKHPLYRTPEYTISMKLQSAAREKDLMAGIIGAAPPKPKTVVQKIRTSTTNVGNSIKTGLGRKKSLFFSGSSSPPASNSATGRRASV